MSTRVQTWVFLNSEATGNDRLVLLALADEADDDGGSCYPSIQRLALKTRCNARTVRRCIERLEADGALDVERGGAGRGNVNRYRILLDKGDNLSPLPAGIMGPPGAPLAAEKRGEKGRPGVHQTHKPTNQNTRVEQQTLVEDQNAVSNDHDEDSMRGFDLFWSVYPARNGRKADKPDAVAKWKRLSLDDKRAAYRAAVNLCDAVARGETLAKDAHRFLTNRRWEAWLADPDPAERRRPPWVPDNAVPDGDGGWLIEYG
jgi:hypothetical protein